MQTICCVFPTELVTSLRCEVDIKNSFRCLRHLFASWRHSVMEMHETWMQRRLSRCSRRRRWCFAASDANAVVVYISDGDKYRLVERGLRIEKLDLRDNGTYECRAEVSSHGNLKVRTVTVDVQCESVLQVTAIQSSCCCRFYFIIVIIIIYSIDKT